MNVLKAISLLGLDIEDVFENILHWVGPKLAKPALTKFLKNASDETRQKWGRLLVMAGNKLQKGNVEGAAGDISRFIGEIKL